MEIQLNKSQLIEWLGSGLSISIISLSVISDVREVHSNISSPIQVYQAIQQHSSYFKDGTYLVNYEETETNEEEIDYSNYAYAFTLLVKITNGPITGGYLKLKEALANFEYIQDVNRESFGYSGYFLVRTPSDPLEYKKLREVLTAHSTMFSLPENGASEHICNFIQGGGLGL